MIVQVQNRTLVHNITHNYFRMPIAIPNIVARNFCMRFQLRMGKSVLDIDIDRSRIPTLWISLIMLCFLKCGVLPIWIHSGTVYSVHQVNWYEWAIHMHMWLEICLLRSFDKYTVLFFSFVCLFCFYCFQLSTVIYYFYIFGSSIRAYYYIHCTLYIRR